MSLSNCRPFKQTISSKGICINLLQTLKSNIEVNHVYHDLYSSVSIPRIYVDGLCQRHICPWFQYTDHMLLVYLISSAQQSSWSLLQILGVGFTEVTSHSEMSRFQILGIQMRTDPTVQQYIGVRQLSYKNRILKVSCYSLILFRVVSARRLLNRGRRILSWLRSVVM